MFQSLILKRRLLTELSGSFRQFSSDFKPLSFVDMLSKMSLGFAPEEEVRAGLEDILKQPLIMTSPDIFQHFKPQEFNANDLLNGGYAFHTYYAAVNEALNAGLPVPRFPDPFDPGKSYKELLKYQKNILNHTDLYSGRVEWTPVQLSSFLRSEFGNFRPHMPYVRFPTMALTMPIPMKLREGDDVNTRWRWSCWRSDLKFMGTDQEAFVVAPLPPHLRSSHIEFPNQLPLRFMVNNYRGLMNLTRRGAYPPKTYADIAIDIYIRQHMVAGAYHPTIKRHPPRLLRKWIRPDEEAGFTEDGEPDLSCFCGVEFELPFNPHAPSAVHQLAVHVNPTTEVISVLSMTTLSDQFDDLYEGEMPDRAIIESRKKVAEFARQNAQNRAKALSAPRRRAIRDFALQAKEMHIDKGVPIQEIEVPAHLKGAIVLRDEFGNEIKPLSDEKIKEEASLFPERSPTVPMLRASDGSTGRKLEVDILAIDRPADDLYEQKKFEANGVFRLPIARDIGLEGIGLKGMFDAITMQHKAEIDPRIEDARKKTEKQAKKRIERSTRFNKPKTG